MMRRQVLMARKNSEKWVPEIVYEEGGSKIPYIHVPDEEQDPGILFIFISRQTGETEPGDDGEEVPIVEMDLRQFADMSAMKSRLPTDVYDQVRAAVGLLPLKEAADKGRQISGLVKDGVEHRAVTERDSRRPAIEEEIQKRMSEKRMSD